MNVVSQYRNDSSQLDCLLCWRVAAEQHLKLREGIKARNCIYTAAKESVSLYAFVYLKRPVTVESGARGPCHKF